MSRQKCRGFHCIYFRQDGQLYADPAIAAIPNMAVTEDVRDTSREIQSGLFIRQYDGPDNKTVTVVWWELE